MSQPALPTWLYTSLCAVAALGSLLRSAASPGPYALNVTRIKLATAQIPDPRQPADDRGIEALIGRLREVEYGAYGLGPEGLPPGLDGPPPLRWVRPMVACTITGDRGFPTSYGESYQRIGPVRERPQAESPRGPHSPAYDLIELGPRALPQLLKHLDDATPTREFIPIGRGMCLLRELPFNPQNARERSIVEPELIHYSQSDASKWTHARYNVKVGDICFVLIGEIVDRDYDLVLPKPLSPLNSPVEDPTLARLVRRLWSRDLTSQPLLDSLIADLDSRAPEPSATNFEEAERLSDIQSGAALRLVRWFPRESATELVKRLDGLVLCAEDQSAPYPGVSPVDFVNAIGWSRDTQIRAALRRSMRRTTSIDLLGAIVQNLDKGDAPSAFERVYRATILHDPADMYAVNGLADLLMECMSLDLSKSEGLIDRLLANATETRTAAAVQAVLIGKPPWTVRALARLLGDERTIHADLVPNLVTPDAVSLRELRLKDLAAMSICMYRKESTFSLAASRANRDARIHALLSTLQDLSGDP